MNQSINIHIRAILLMALMLLMPSMMWADKETWVEYADGTLTFHYDENQASCSNQTYSLPASGEDPDWLVHKSSITEVVFSEDFKDARPERCTKWFYQMTYLATISHLDYLNSSEVNDMSNMFNGCESLTELDLHSFNTEHVTTMTGMFADCDQLTQIDLSAFNTQNVDDMSKMFSFCSSLTTLDLTSFDTQKVTNMTEMFDGDSNLSLIKVSFSFVTDQVTASERMFRDCVSLPSYKSYYTDKEKASDYLTYLSLQPWVEYADGTLTFHYDVNRNICSNQTYDLPASGADPDWLEHKGEITKVVFSESFKDVRPQRLAKWFYEMDGLTDIQGMEYLCTDSVTDMSEMFGYCEHIATLDLTAFDTHKVTDMSGMFTRCMDLTVIYVSELFVVDQVTSSDNMFWACIGLPPFDNEHTDKTKAHEYLTYLSRQPWVEYQESAKTLTFHYDARKDLVTADAKYDLPEEGADPGWADKYYVEHVVFLSNFAKARPERCTKWFSQMMYLTEIQGMEYLCTDSVNDMSQMFNQCSSLTSLDVSHFNTERVTTMAWMFSECESLTALDVTSFNTAKVDDMSYMFNLCSSLTSLDVSHFNTERVTTMAWMFSECESLTALDVTSFNTAKVDDMSYMFNLCSSLTSLDVSHFNTERVTTMAWMFSECESLTALDVTSFNTAKVDDMSYMFNLCSKLTELDLSSFDTRKVTNMAGMFIYDQALTHIYVSDLFAVNQVEKSDYMFNTCYALPNYRFYSTGKKNAHYKESEGGYLTLRRKMSVGDKQYNVDGYNSPTCYTDVAFTDGEPYSAPCAFTFDTDNSASYTRSVSNHWATLCLPFAFSADNSTARFYSVGSYTNDNIAVTALTGTIEAGTPVLAYVSEGNELSVTATGAAAVADAKQLTELKGTFAQTEVADEDYIIANDHFWNAAWLKENNSAVKNVYVAPYRASLTLTSTEAKPNSISIDLGETDGIDSIEATDPSAFLEGAELYDLQGRRLTAPKSGVMIIRKGGVSRKVVIKGSQAPQGL